MGVMHIPGHTHQAPREVALEEIEAVLGDCHLASSTSRVTISCLAWETPALV